MFNKAQAGIEYLLSYGWALILVVTVKACTDGFPQEGVHFSDNCP